MRVLGVTLHFYRSPGTHDAGGLAAMTKTQAGALLVLPHPFTYVHKIVKGTKPADCPSSSRHSSS